MPELELLLNNEMDDFATAPGTPNQALARLMPRVQWQQSYVTPDATFCVYLAEDEAAIHEHAKLSGFPASRVIEITGVIDPSTGRS